MIYSEASYAGPDIHGRTFTAYHFAHIAAWQEYRRIFRIAAPMGQRGRISSDSVWPLRGADGRTFAERGAR